MGSIIALICGIISGIATFVIIWGFSDYFIPPRYNWSKSIFSVFLIKLGAAGGGAFVVFAFISNLVLNYLK
jgi:hypothetical protein